VQDIQGHPESTPTPRDWPASRWIRLILTLLGVGGLITAAFRDWIQSLGGWGVTLHVRVLWNPNEPTTITGGGIASVGFVALALGAIALMGLVPRVGWLTVVAGALAVAEATLFIVTAVRASGYEPAGNMTVGDLQVGVWALLVGGILLVIAGFLGPRRSRAPAPEVESPLLHRLSEPSEQDPRRP
jgi:hypothetical protein